MQEPCWIIDILPERVPEDRAGQYFAVEKYYLDPVRLADVKQKHINLILKLNCYRDLSVDEDRMINPPPEELAEAIRNRYLCILTNEALIVSEKDDTHLSLFSQDERLLELVRLLAAGEGLYLWKA